MKKNLNQCETQKSINIFMVKFFFLDEEPSILLLLYAHLGFYTPEVSTVIPSGLIQVSVVILNNLLRISNLLILKYTKQSYSI